MPHDSLPLASPLQNTPSFAAWLLSTTRSVAKIGGAGALIAAAFTIANLDIGAWFTAWTSNQDPQAAAAAMKELQVAKRGTLGALFFIQCIACVLYAVLTPGTRDHLRDSKPGDQPRYSQQSSKAAARIRLCVHANMWIWAAYYATNALLCFGTTHRRDVSFGVATNLLSAVGLYWLYVEMTEVTKLSNTPTAAERNSRDRAFHLRLGSFVFLIVGWWALVIADSTNRPWLVRLSVAI